VHSGKEPQEDVTNMGCFDCKHLFEPTLLSNLVGKVADMESALGQGILRRLTSRWDIFLQSLKPIDVGAVVLSLATLSHVVGPLNLKARGPVLRY
jgi:hypothetical protein